jgi:hypothetical protein
LNVPLILVIFKPEFVQTFLITTDVPITMHVLLIDVLLKDVSTLSKIVPITMHVLKMFVIQELDNVFILLSLVLLPIVNLENATLKLDAKQLLETVMIKLHVPLMFAVKIVDATILLMITFVMIVILAPLTNVTLNKDVFTPKSVVTTTTLAPLMYAPMENANSSMHANNKINALFLLAIL